MLTKGDWDIKTIVTFIVSQTTDFYSKTIYKR